jgi:hypothetical protein
VRELARYHTLGHAGEALGDLFVEFRAEPQRLSLSAVLRRGCRVAEPKPERALGIHRASSIRVYPRD